MTISGLLYLIALGGAAVVAVLFTIAVTIVNLWGREDDGR